jgi:hypothetical protein
LTLAARRAARDTGAFSPIALSLLLALVFLALAYASARNRGLLARFPGGFGRLFRALALQTGLLAGPLLAALPSLMTNQGVRIGAAWVEAPMVVLMAVAGGLALMNRPGFPGGSRFREGGAHGTETTPTEIFAGAA